MARAHTPAPRRVSGRRALVILTAAGGLALAPLLTPLPAAAEPQTSQEAAEVIAARSHDLEVVTERFNEARERLKAQEEAVAQAAEEVAAAEEALTGAREKVRTVARSAWTGERLTSLQALLTSDSPDDLLDRVGTLDTIAEHTNGVLGEAQDAGRAAEAARTTAERAEADAAALVERVAAQQADLDAQIAEFQALHDRLLAEEERAARAAAERAAAERAAREAAEREAAQRAAAEQAAPAPAAGTRSSAPAPAAAPAPAPAPAPARPAPAGGGSGAARTAVDTALAQVGDPYVWAAAGPNAFDCSGLVQYAYRAAGISVPHSSRMQSQMGTPVSRSALKPGDLVFFYSPVSHVGIYIGNGQMVHASTAGQPVKVASIGSMPSYHSARRIA